MTSGNQPQWKTVLLLSFAVCEFDKELKGALISLRIHYYMTISAAQVNSLSSALHILKTESLKKF